jgi:N-methylhydantoinase A
VAGPAPVVDPGRTSTHTARPSGTRPIWSPERGELVEATVVDRYALSAGQLVHGPAIIEERESTAVIGVGGIGRLDDVGNLRVQIHG